MRVGEAGFLSRCGMPSSIPRPQVAKLMADTAVCASLTVLERSLLQALRVRFNPVSPHGGNAIAQNTAAYAEQLKVGSHTPGVGSIICVQHS